MKQPQGSMTTASSPFAEFSKRWLPAVESALEAVLPAPTTPPAVLHRAMRHAMFPGGKRLRPMCAMLAAQVSGGDPSAAVRPAAALELLHTYSLVHDDLPCMDDDDLRRGRPTCHVVFGEANALLAGDALLTLAFEIVAEGGSEAVRALARAAGSLGMVGGQVGDLAAEAAVSPVDLAGLEWIHDRKTGALIVASFEIGLFAGSGDRRVHEPLVAYGRALGRAFQVVDDILDCTASAEQLGKAANKDAARGKATYPGLLGIEGARQAAALLAAEAAAQAETIASRIGGTALETHRALLEDLALSTVARTR
jgi:geranylgeranyl diphosphate synthase type II